jgi:hypothetical protein
MSASLASIKYAMKVLLSDEFCSRDPAILPIGWREPDLKRQTDLSFGFLEFDGVVRPHPPITRALHCVKDALISMGHEVVSLPIWMFPQNGLTDNLKVIAWEGPPLSRAVDIHVTHNDILTVGLVHTLISRTKPFYRPVSPGPMAIAMFLNN